MNTYLGIVLSDKVGGLFSQIRWTVSYHLCVKGTESSHCPLHLCSSWVTRSIQKNCEVWWTGATIDKRKKLHLPFKWAVLEEQEGEVISTPVLPHSRFPTQLQEFCYLKFQKSYSTSEEHRSTTSSTQRSSILPNQMLAILKLKLMSTNSWDMKDN